MKLTLKTLSFIVLIMALLSLTIGVAFAGTPVVTPGTDPTAVILGGVRYRELASGNDAEVFLGIPDLGDAGRRTETNLTWGSSNTITLVYDAVLDKLSTTVDNGTSQWTLDYPVSPALYSDRVRDLVFGGSQALADEALAKLNYIQIDVRLQENSPAQVSLNDVYLDTFPLGNFSGVNHQTLSWQVNGYDLSAGFTLTGVLNLSNVTSPSAELNKIDISFGNVNADVFAPTVSNVTAAPDVQTGGGGVTLTATVDDSTSGDSIIQSADYRVGGGTWNPMNASDGSFDSSTENVTALIVAPSIDGPYSLCVRGTDSANNVSSEQCTTLNIDSQAPLTSSVVVDPQKSGGNASVNLTALVDDSSTGGSNIQSAEYSTNGINWTTMTAQDGSFNSPTETVNATFLSPASSGDVNVCVRGTDAAGNAGTETCTTLTIDSESPLVSAVALDPNPADAWAQVTLTASVDDSTTGNSNIASAEFRIGGGTWMAMLPGDGSFDSPVEEVSAQFGAPLSGGLVDICVRGSDAFGNTGSPVCAQLEINAPVGPPPLFLPVAVKN